MIKEDYDRRIERLQGREVPEREKTGFWMGMGSKTLKSYLSDKIKSSAKADADRLSGMADTVIYDLVATILSSGGRGTAKFTVSLDAGNSTYATDTIPGDGIYELTDGMRLCFSDSDLYAKATDSCRNSYFPCRIKPCHYGDCDRHPIHIWIQDVFYHV